MDADNILLDLKKRMEDAISYFKKNLSGLSTGRASSSLLDNVKVEIYGQFMPISQLGTVNVPESRTITVQVWDKSMVKNIEKAIANANLGLNPINDGGQLIRIPIPDLSEQRRHELSKKVNEYNEQCKVALRNIRRESIDSIKKLEKEKQISEDEAKNYNNDIQKVINDFVTKADQLSAQKSKDIMTI